MSDTSQGDGWWVASDGKWYPPEQAPGAAAAVPSEPPTTPMPIQPPAAASDAGPPSTPPPYGSAAPPFGPSTPAYTATAPAPGGGSKTGLVAIVCLLVGALLGGGVAYAVAAGSDSGADATEWVAFCDEVDRLEARQERGELDEDDAAEALSGLVATAPERYQPMLQTFADLAETSESDEPSLDGFDAFGDILMFAGFFGTVLEVECGIEPDDLDLDFGMGGSSDFDFGEFDMDEFDMDEFDMDEFDMDDPSESDDLDDPMSIDSIQAALEAEFGGASWLEQISSWTVSNSRDVDVAPFEAWLADTDPIDACEGLASYVLTQEPDATIRVLDEQYEPLVELTPDTGTCQTVG